MSLIKKAFTMVLIVWHTLRLSYLQTAIRQQIAGRGWADKDADESLKVHLVALQLARAEFHTLGEKQ